MNAKTNATKKEHNMNNTLKKIISVSVVCTLALAMFAGCTKEKENNAPEADQQIEDQVENQDEDESKDEGEDEDDGVQIANPMAETTKEDILSEIGVDLTAPEGSENVKYYTITDESDKTYEMSFTSDGVEYCYRVTPTGEVKPTDTTGLNYTWTTTENTTVAERAAIYSSCADASALYWIDIVPGINYSIGCKGEVALDVLTAVAESVFAPVQGNN